MNHSPVVPAARRSRLTIAAIVLALLFALLLPLSPAYGDGLDGTIAFVSDRTGADQVYVMDADGSRVTQLTDNPGFDRAPAWSPDGTSLVFNSRREPHSTRPQLYTVDVTDPISVRQVSFSETEDLRASWFPDGTAVVFQRGGLFDGPNLFRLDVASGESTLLTDTPGRIDAAGAVSPDGTTLALQSNRNLTTGFFPFRLFLIDLATNQVAQVATPPSDGSDDGSDDGPQWSPSGSQLVFARSGNLRLYDLGSGATTLLTDGGEFDIAPSWSPDGRFLVFQSDRVEEDGGIHLYDLETGEISYLGEGRTPVWTATQRPSDSDSPRVPQTRDDCKHGGWRQLADASGEAFVNQGRCVSSVASDGRAGRPPR